MITLSCSEAIKAYERIMFSLKIVFVLSVVVAMASAAGFNMVGGVSPLSGDDLKEAEKTLNTSLTKLAAGDGPTWTIEKVYEATSQVVSGSLHKFVVDLKNSEGVVKKCKVAIWSQPWLKNGIEVTIDCEGEEKVVKKHSA